MEGANGRKEENWQRQGRRKEERRCHCLVHHFDTCLLPFRGQLPFDFVRRYGQTEYRKYKLYMLLSPPPLHQQPSLSNAQPHDDRAAASQETAARECDTYPTQRQDESNCTTAINTGYLLQATNFTWFQPSVIDVRHIHQLHPMQRRLDRW